MLFTTFQLQPGYMTSTSLPAARAARPEVR
jgi:hypothetical protein